MKKLSKQDRKDVCTYMGKMAEELDRARQPDFANKLREAAREFKSVQYSPREISKALETQTCDGMLIEQILMELGQ